MKTIEFDYNLPEQLIAKYPPAERGTSRLMVVDRKTGTLFDKKYSDIVEYLQPNDIVVLNKTKVIKVRLYAKVERSGKDVQCLFLHPVGENRWYVLIGRAKDVKTGDILKVSDGTKEHLKVLERPQNSDGFNVEVVGSTPEELFQKYGHVPLPPYMQREDEKSDETRYNTVFAEEKGSVAAPTASLNITEELMESFKTKGAEISYLNLDIGWGTFQPVRTENIEDFKIHSESFELTEKAAEGINQAKSKGGRVFSFGTTATRVLESCTDKNGRLSARSGETELFIYPGYSWKAVDALVTNFHAPQSSLIMLVSSFAGYELTMKAYREAVKRGYRFLSYGDSMLIL